MLRAGFGGYELVQHHAQGEFHHDVVLRVKQARALPSEWLVVSTNCNGGVKEVVSTRELADPIGLWRWRCPDNAASGSVGRHAAGFAQQTPGAGAMEERSDDGAKRRWSDGELEGPEVPRPGKTERGLEVPHVTDTERAR